MPADHREVGTQELKKTSTGFVVDLIGKCTEGLQMNWEKYLVNQLDID
jgi:hypothetical protein